MVFLQQVRKMPFLRIVIPYLTGLIGGYYGLPPASFRYLLGACLVLIALLLFLNTRKTSHYPYSWLAGILVSTVLVLLGAANILSRETIRERYSLTPEMRISRLVIMDTPEIRPGSVQTVVKIRTLDSAQRSKWMPAKAIIRFQRTAGSESIRAGDIILVQGRFLPVPRPANPGEFDYRRYLSRKEIDYQIYADSAVWALAGHENRNLKIIALRCRDNLLARFRASPLDPQATAVISALTLGYKTDLEAETTELFTRAGVIHVMALSGFNVGIIFVMVNFCLGFLRKRGFQGLLRLVLSLTAVWAFVIVTGLSSSVTRAGIMISLFLAGKYISRDASPVNIVSASAFLMLVISPYNLFDVGFQLSFSAVLGIIYVQPGLYGLLTVKNKIADKLWILFTVSVAAQLATAPLTLHYFHMFPLFFWITNLYVVPMVTLIIYLSIPFLLLSSVQPVMILLSRLLDLLIRAVTVPLDWLSGFPLAVADGIFISKIQVVLLYAILIVSLVFFMYRKIRYIPAGVMLLLAFMIPESLRYYPIRRQTILSVNSIRGASILNILSGKQNLVMSFSGPPPDKKLLHYSFYNWWVKHGVAGTAEIRTAESIIAEPFRGNAAFSLQDSIIGRNVLLNFSGITLVVCTDDIFTKVESGRKLKTDYMVITKAIRPNVKKLLKHFNTGTLIIDSSVGYYESMKWTTLCRENKIDCWPVREKGAFVLQGK